MKIISYNVNGLRAAIKKDIVGWLKQEAPDVLCIQETKLQPDQYDASVFEELGYESYLTSAVKKGYSGVAILTRRKPDKVEVGIGIDRYDQEGRFIRADFGDLTVASIYHPSGQSGDVRQSFKMEWLEDFQAQMKGLRTERPKLILTGDYNICHEAIDIHDPIRNATVSGFLPEERDWMTGFLADGYTDSFRFLNPEEVKYSWWSYRTRARERNKGWRIDYCMCTDNLRPDIHEAFILNDAVHSDHCPVGVTIDEGAL